MIVRSPRDTDSENDRRIIRLLSAYGAGWAEQRRASFRNLRRAFLFGEFRQVREGIVDRSSWLKVAAGLSFFMAAGQAIISISPAAAAYFQAPPSLLNDRVRMLVVGGAAALVPLLFGLYALSGAGVIRRLPLLRTVLVAVGSLFLLRGLFIILTFLEALGLRQGQILLPGVASHVVFLSAGIAYLGGAVLNWKTLRSR
jgi:hypothetical protein